MLLAVAFVAGANLQSVPFARLQSVSDLAGLVKARIANPR